MTQRRGRGGKFGIERMCSERVLWAAWGRVARGTTMAGADGVTTDAFARRLSGNLTALAAHLRSGTYRPQPLRRFTRKTGDKERVFGLPAVRDRVAQHAFLGVWGGLLDAQLVDTSFAYRKGAGWMAALSRVEAARDQGLRWVFRGDVARFFESIDHDCLVRTLADVLPDARLLSLVHRWVSVPTITENGLADAETGVPLGAPISPVLANQYLRDVDREIARFGLPVRYADDFVVLCPDLEAAGRARLDVELALDHRHVLLNRAKSYVSSFEQGFAFLGWVFWRDGGHEADPSDRSWRHPMTGRAGAQRAS